MVNRLEIPRMTGCFVCLFFSYMIELLRLFQKRSCVLSNVATIGTLLDEFILSWK